LHGQLYVIRTSICLGHHYKGTAMNVTHCLVKSHPSYKDTTKHARNWNLQRFLHLQWACGSDHLSWTWESFR